MKSDYLYNVCNILLAKGWLELPVKKGQWLFRKKGWICEVFWKSFNMKFTRI